MIDEIGNAREAAGLCCPRCEAANLPQRKFCAKCGGQLAFVYKGKNDSIGLNVGCFDHPDRLKPEKHIYTDTMIPWLHMRDGLPRTRGH